MYVYQEREYEQTVCGGMPGATAPGSPPLHTDNTETRTRTTTGRDMERRQTRLGSPRHWERDASSLWARRRAHEHEIGAACSGCGLWRLSERATGGCAKGFA
eukprot:scaffold3867_cov160-Isochrysis_galbana.AAC.4